AERTKATSTPRMVAPCEARRPMTLPPKAVPSTPAMSEPTRGASGTASSVEADSVLLMFRSALQRIEFFDADRRLVAEQQHEDGEADGCFGGRHGEDEEHEDLAVQIAQVVREGHEVQVDRQQHELDGHEQHDQVAAVEEDRSEERR